VIRIRYLTLRTQIHGARIHVRGIQSEIRRFKEAAQLLSPQADSRLGTARSPREQAVDKITIARLKIDTSQNQLGQLEQASHIFPSIGFLLDSTLAAAMYVASITLLPFVVNSNKAIVGGLSGAAITCMLAWMVGEKLTKRGYAATLATGAAIGAGLSILKSAFSYIAATPAIGAAIGTELSILKPAFSYIPVFTIGTTAIVGVVSLIHMATTKMRLVGNACAILPLSRETDTGKNGFEFVADAVNRCVSAAEEAISNLRKQLQCMGVNLPQPGPTGTGQVDNRWSLPALY
jgi:hypothetical protein